MKKEDLFVILSHCDTDKKTDALRRCIESLSMLDKIIVSHISVPETATSKCDLTIVSPHNPIVRFDESESLGVPHPINRYTSRFLTASHPFLYNHGYAALLLIQEGCRYAKAEGYENVHFLNYDYLISNETLHMHIGHLEDKDLVYYGWDGQDMMNCGFFSAKTAMLSRALRRMKSIKEYYAHGTLIEETILNTIRSLKNVTIELISKSESDSFNTITSIISPHVRLENDAVVYTTLHRANDDNDYALMYRMHRENNNITLNVLHDEKEACVVIPAYGFYTLIKIGKHDDDNVVSVFKDREADPSITLDHRFGATMTFNDANDIGPCLQLGTMKATFDINFNDGPHVYIDTRDKDIEHVVRFSNADDKIVFESKATGPSHVKALKRFFVPWKIDILHGNELMLSHRLDLKGRNVRIIFESSSLGDHVCWFGAIDEFRKKHGANVYASTYHDDLFKENYQDIKFVSRNTKIQDTYATYRIGWFYKDAYSIDPDVYMHPSNVRQLPMSRTSTDILGLPHKQIKPRLVLPKNMERPMKERYVTIGTHATCQPKYWNHPNGWQTVVDEIRSMGYEVMSVSRESDGHGGNAYPSRIINACGDAYTMQDRIRQIANSDLFIGLGSGLSWLAWALNVPTILISGFSEPYTEMTDDNVHRVYCDDASICHGCFNRMRLNQEDWNWCPMHKGTERQFECTKTITSQRLIETIKNILMTKKE